MTAVVPYYTNEKCYKIYIQKRKEDIKNCKECIKQAEKRIKEWEYYPDWLKLENVK